MAEQLLKLKNIYKNFGNVKVLKDVNITINKGEVVALIGDNGAGKSPLIKVITGVHRPNSGKIFFKESEVEIKSVSQSRKMGIEAVYQERALCEQQELYRKLLHFKKCNLKIFDKIIKEKKIIKIISKDKKNFNDNINFSLINKIGSSIFYKKLDKDKVYKILQNI